MRSNRRKACCTVLVISETLTCSKGLSGWERQAAHDCRRFRSRYRDKNPQTYRRARCNDYLVLESNEAINRQRSTQAHTQKLEQQFKSERNCLRSIWWVADIWPVGGSPLSAHRFNFL